MTILENPAYPLLLLENPALLKAKITFYQIQEEAKAGKVSEDAKRFMLPETLYLFEDGSVYEFSALPFAMGFLHKDLEHWATHADQWNDWVWEDLIDKFSDQGRRSEINSTMLK